VGTTDLIGTLDGVIEAADEIVEAFGLTMVYRDIYDHN
jgi:hypothetical protein